MLRLNSVNLLSDYCVVDIGECIWFTNDRYEMGMADMKSCEAGPQYQLFSCTKRSGTSCNNRTPVTNEQTPIKSHGNRQVSADISTVHVEFSV